MLEVKFEIVNDDKVFSLADYVKDVVLFKERVFMAILNEDKNKSIELIEIAYQDHIGEEIISKCYIDNKYYRITFKDSFGNKKNLIIKIGA